MFSSEKCHTVLEAESSLFRNFPACQPEAKGNVSHPVSSQQPISLHYQGVPAQVHQVARKEEGKEVGGIWAYLELVWIHCEHWAMTKSHLR